MNKKNIILGAGRHALETFRNYLQNHNIENFAGFYEDKTISSIEELEGYRVLDINSLLMDENASNQYNIITAIGSLARISMIHKLENAGFDFFNIISNNVVLQHDFKCGNDVYIAQGVIITSNVTIGSHVIINIKSSISHDAIIGNNVIISPGVTICGKVKIGNNVFIGAGATIIDDIVIGDNSFIAAGSCVVKAVQPNTQVGGVPAKFMKDI